MKGLLKSLEVVISILLIIATYIIFYSGEEALPEFQTINWKLLGFRALEALDKNNELKSDALANNTQTIKSKLANFIPANLYYDLQICQLNCSMISKPEASKMTSVEYLIAGEENNFAPRQLILYIWSVE